jgi:hypothetical protein
MSGGARYEIAIGGTPRTYRDTIEGAWAAATNLKMKQKRRHLPGKTVARDRPSSGGETLCSAADMFDGNPEPRAACRIPHSREKSPPLRARCYWHGRRRRC